MKEIELKLIKIKQMVSRALSDVQAIEKKRKPNGKGTGKVFDALKKPRPEGK